MANCRASTGARRVIQGQGTSRRLCLRFSVSSESFGGLSECPRTGVLGHHLQRYENEALFAYSVMGAALMAIILLTLVGRILAIRMEKQRKAQMFGMSDTEGIGQNA